MTQKIENGEKLTAAGFLRWYNTLLTSGMAFVIIAGVGKLDKGFHLLNKVASDMRIMEVKFDGHKIETDSKIRDLREIDREIQSELKKCIDRNK